MNFLIASAIIYVVVVFSTLLFSLQSYKISLEVKKTQEILNQQNQEILKKLKSVDSKVCALNLNSKIFSEALQFELEKKTAAKFKNQENFFKTLAKEKSAEYLSQLTDYIAVNLAKNCYSSLFGENDNFSDEGRRLP